MTVAERPAKHNGPSGPLSRRAPAEVPARRGAYFGGGAGSAAVGTAASVSRVTSSR